MQHIDTSRSQLTSLVEKLHRQYGDPFVPPTTDPFGLILWEQVAYLVNDERRTEAYSQLEMRVGLTPEDVLEASLETLEEVARSGGAIAAPERAARMQRTARVAVEEWAGDLMGVVTLPPAEARRTLKRFPMIGEPGADKILMLPRSHPVLALDSNGLRVLVRVGYGAEGKSYSTTYRNVQKALAPAIRPDFDWLIAAHGSLRRHGQVRCKWRAPRCTGSCLRKTCGYAPSGRRSA